MAPLIGTDLFTPPAPAWITSGRWTKGGAVISQSAMNQIMNAMLRRIIRRYYGVPLSR